MLYVNPQLSDAYCFGGLCVSLFCLFGSQISTQYWFLKSSQVFKIMFKFPSDLSWHFLVIIFVSSAAVNIYYVKELYRSGLRVDIMHSAVISRKIFYSPDIGMSSTNTVCLCGLVRDRNSCQEVFLCEFLVNSSYT